LFKNRTETANYGTVKILLVEDHTLFREGLRHLLRAIDATVQMDATANCAEALECLGDRTYDLVLLDLKLPGVQGLDALTTLREVAPFTPIVALSGEEDPDVVYRVVEAGAMGFIPKSSTSDVLIQAMQLVLAKGIYLPPSVLNPIRSERTPLAVPDRNAALARLSKRQMDVLRCILRGQPNKAIARQLELSEATVKTHLRAVFAALGVHNRTQAVYAAAKLGLRIA
jgi:DNA-binding NarL/FixJ family response regulator